MGHEGRGRATAATNMTMIAGTVDVVCELPVLAKKLNLCSVRLLSVVGLGAAGNRLPTYRGKTLLEDSFGVGFKLSLWLKDLTINRALAQELNINMPMAEAVITDYARLMELGDGDSDISGLIRLKRDTNTIQCEH